MFSLSPRHQGRANTDFVGDHHRNTSSTDLSSINLPARSTLSHETVFYNAKASHDEATPPTEIGAISGAATQAMICGLSCNSLLAKAQSCQASEIKISVDEIAEQQTALLTLGIGRDRHTFVVPKGAFLVSSDHVLASAAKKSFPARNPKGSLSETVISLFSWWPFSDCNRVMKSFQFSK